jgi:hypothetical protein
MLKLVVQRRLDYPLGQLAGFRADVAPELLVVL